MNCIVLESSPAIKENLAYILLPLGITAISVGSKDEALKALKSNEDIVAAIIDIDNAALRGLELVKVLRETPETRNVRIIVDSGRSSKDFIVKLVELGIHGYFLKPFDAERVAQKLKSILVDRMTQHPEKRRHIRVEPDPDELLRMHFRMPSHPNLISGKIRNISLGGVALELFHPPEANVLKPGTLIPNLQFTLDGKQLSPSGHVVLCRGKLLAMRFGELSGPDKSSLARYIYRSLSAQNRGQEETSPGGDGAPSGEGTPDDGGAAAQGDVLDEAGSADEDGRVPRG